MSTILNSTCYLIWVCILLHLIADFCMQGILCDLKQEEWWKKQVEEKWAKYGGDWRRGVWRKYRFDYIAGLLCHSVMWSLVTFFPLMFVANPVSFSVLVVLNVAVHAYVDNLKANKITSRINLCKDQLIHLVQVVATVLLYQIHIEVTL